MKFKFLAGFLLICSAGEAWAGPPAAKRAAPITLQIAGLEVGAWLPDRATPEPWPIIIFSHGFHGCNTQSTFLMEALAKAGYAVFAPNHRDASCKRNFRGRFSRPEAPFRDPKDWDDATYAERGQDIRKLLDALSSNEHYRSPPFDWQHVGLAGHSLGGYTVLGVAGAWARWRDPRVKAVLALSPFSTPFIERHTLGGLNVPVMYQGGTRDYGITPYINRASGAYDQSSAPKYFVDFEGAGHLAWTDIRDTDHAEIVEYSLAFLDRYLKSKPFPPALNRPHAGVSAVKMEE
jgi:predicted dienelactone hydrolase